MVLLKAIYQEKLKNNQSTLATGSSLDIRVKSQPDFELVCNETFKSNVLMKTLKVKRNSKLLYE